MPTARKPGRRRLDPDSMTRPLTIKLSDALLAQVTIAAQRADQSRGEWIREAIELALEGAFYVAAIDEGRGVVTLASMPTRRRLAHEMAHALGWYR